MILDNGPRNRYTTKEDWNQYYDSYKPEKIERVYFSDLFDAFFKKDTAKSVLEIGCAGGKNLCFLAKYYGFQPYGIDYSDKIKTTYELFKYNGLPEPALYKEDVFSWKPDRQFDVVCSFGFIEHFENINEIIKKHISLVAPGGILIVTLPNFARGQYFFHWLIDRENLRKHNTKIMNLASINKAFIDQPVAIKYLAYYKTFGFWHERNTLLWWEKIIYYSVRKFGKALNLFFGYDYPNSIFSPHIICVAIKD